LTRYFLAISSMSTMERTSGSARGKSASLPPQAATNVHRPTTTATANKSGARITRGTSGAGTTQLTKSREDLYKESEVKWLDTSTLDVKKHLYTKGFTADESSSVGDLGDLAMILLRIAADANSVVTADACRAVVVLLERQTGQEVMDGIAGDVRRVLRLVEQLVPDPHELQDGGDKGAAGDLQTVAEMLTSVVEQQCQDMWELMGRLEEEVTQVVKRVNKAVVEGSESRGWEGGEEGPVPPAPMVQAGVSYVAVAGMHGAALPLLQHAVAVASTRAKNCQILIDRSPVVSTNSLEKLSEKELVVKANWALAEAIKVLGEQAAPERVVFVGAQSAQQGDCFPSQHSDGSGVDSGAKTHECVPGEHGWYVDIQAPFLLSCSGVRAGLVQPGLEQRAGGDWRVQQYREGGAGAGKVHQARGSMSTWATVCTRDLRV
jgi:hypothetical protein